MSQTDLDLDPDRDAMLRGCTLVQASAGTGKTWTIEQIVLRRVRAGASVRRMVLMSFTHAAADELAERVRQTLRRALVAPESGEAPADATERRNVELALLEIDACCITTIHGFCQRMLQEHGAEAGPHGLAGWTLDPDPVGTERCAALDALSATAMQDSMWWGLLRTPDAVDTRLRQALHSRQAAQQVAQADYHAALQAWRHAEVALAACTDLPDPLRQLDACLQAADAESHDEGDAEAAEGAQGVHTGFAAVAECLARVQRGENDPQQRSMELGLALESIHGVIEPDAEQASDEAKVCRPPVPRCCSACWPAPQAPGC